MTCSTKTTSEVDDTRHAEWQATHIVALDLFTGQKYEVVKAEAAAGSCS